MMLICTRFYLKHVSLENGALAAFISVDIVGMVRAMKLRGIATVDVAQDIKTPALAIKVHKRLLHIKSMNLS